MTDETDDSCVKPWTIKGIGPEVRNQAITAAKRAGMGIGPWTSRALQDAIQSEAKASRAIVASAPPPPALPPPDPETTRLVRSSVDVRSAPPAPSVADAAAALDTLLGVADKLAVLRVAGVRSHALAAIGRAVLHQAQSLEGVDLPDRAPQPRPDKRIKG